MINKYLKVIIPSIFILFSLGGCDGNGNEFDASGVFEATEIVISAETNGIIQQFDADEASMLKEGEEVVQIGTIDLSLQKAQVEASIETLIEKQNDAGPQVAILEQQLQSANATIEMLNTQLKVLLKEQQRIDKLLVANAATPQQKDDIDGKVEVMHMQIQTAKSNKEVINSQITSARRSVAIQNRAITSEKKPLEKQKERLEEQMDKASIKSPTSGTLLSKYAYPGELVTIGKPLFRMADLSSMELRAYISGDQLSEIKLGQSVQVFIDRGAEEYRKYDGVVIWISDKAEFTPKSIQTKNERANLVYAMKVKVVNDGYIKIGMYGEVKFTGEDE